MNILVLKGNNKLTVLYKTSVCVEHALKKNNTEIYSLQPLGGIITSTLKQ